MRIHNLGPCGLSGMPDERIVDAPAACNGETGGADEARNLRGVACRPEAGERQPKRSAEEEAPSRQARRKGRAAAQDAQAAGETQDAHDEDAANEAMPTAARPREKRLRRTIRMKSTMQRRAPRPIRRKSPATRTRAAAAKRSRSAKAAATRRQSPKPQPTGRRRARRFRTRSKNSSMP